MLVCGFVLCYIIDVFIVISSVCGMVFWVSVGDNGYVGVIEVLQGKVQVGNFYGQCLVWLGQVICSSSVDVVFVVVFVLLLVLVLCNDVLCLVLLLILFVWELVNGVDYYWVEVVQVVMLEILLFVVIIVDIWLVIGDLLFGQLCILLCVVDVQGVEGLDVSVDFEFGDQLLLLLIVLLLYGQMINSD